MAGKENSARKQESTELLFENRDNFPYASDEDGGSETEAETTDTLLVTPSLSVTPFLSDLFTTSSIVQAKSSVSATSRPLENSHAQTVLPAQGKRSRTSPFPATVSSVPAPIPAQAPPIPTQAPPSFLNNNKRGLDTQSLGKIKRNTN